jgi:iron(III) transport system permease protein
VAAAAIAATVALPLLVVLASWRQPAGDVWMHLWRTQLLELVANTLLLAAGVGAGTLVVGAGLAWLMAAFEFPGRRIFEWALVLPLAMPAYVIGFAFLALFDFAGPVQSTLRRLAGPQFRLPELRSAWGVITMMTLVFYPYVYVLARVAFRAHGGPALEVARSLGLSPARAFVAVMLPLARPSLAAGVALAIMEALADFGTVSTFGYRTLTEAVYRVWTGMFDRVAATQVASVLLMLVLAVLLLERALRGRRRFTGGEGRTAFPRIRLRGWSAAGAVAACAGTLALAFVLPVTELIVWATHVGPEERASRGFAGLVASTFLLAAGSAVLVCLLALVLAYARRLRPSRTAAVAAQFSSLGYSLPGAVIAVGVLAPVAWLDGAFAAVAEWALGHRLGLVLTGSAAAVLFAYAVRFLAVGYQTTEAALARIPPSLDEAARSLGVTMRVALRRVHVPLMRGGILSALTLIWVETIKELPATLLLRPFGLKTLAVEVWERTSESLWAEAALPALAIVAVGLVPLLITTRLDGGRR